MTLKQLREHLASIDDKFADAEVKVWLPGSTIRLSPMFKHPSEQHGGSILIEGNVDPGSALENL